MTKSTYKVVIAAVLMMLLVASGQAAELSDFYVTPAPEAGEGSTPPAEGTSNTIYTIHFTWHEDNNALPDPNTLKLCVYTPYVGSTCYTLPHLAGKGLPSSEEGRLYEFRITAGLNLGEEGLGPGTFNPGHPIADLRDVFYIPILLAKGDGTANTITLRIEAMFTDPEEEEAEPELVGPETADVIIHDSHPLPNVDDPVYYRDRYAGQHHDVDFLYSYYAYGDGIGNPKPIQSFGLNESFQWREPDSAENPDDGSTSTAWEFRVIYRNGDNLPPVPYLGSYGGSLGDDYLGMRNQELSTGVVLYLKNTSWDPDEDFVAVAMQKANEGDNNYAGGVEYVYYVEPQWWNDYVGLGIGEYEWFVACSDDIIRTRDGDIPSWLDPRGTVSPLRRAFDLPMTGITQHRGYGEYWMTFMNRYNTSLYIDRPTLQPGVSNGYAFPANRHPVVSVGLKNPYPIFAPEDGTVDPFYAIVNPQTGDIQVGGAQNQQWDFRIMYQHLYGVLPTTSQGAGGEISVWVNNSNTRTPDPARPETQYVRYTLTRDTTDPLGSDVKDGLLYHNSNRIQLQPGPHSFFFTASDGLKRVRYPVEGHHYAGQHAFTGPYVNHRPVLSDPVVDPPTGTSGDRFRYTVLYKDADNQRPYRARVYIEYAPGQIYIGEMIKENPADSDYDGVGVRYVFDTANMAQQFQVGNRRFYFEFIDDWGAPSDPRDRRQGETVYWQSAQPESWIYGPFINRNTRPQLLDGVVNATDGANNSATLYEYKVRYVDIDNHAPKYLDVYIGQVQFDGTILWDSGHRLDPVDPADNVYNGDGAWFRYNTRLTGDTAPGKDYYYCFAASDRYDVAEYDAVSSPSAGAVWMTWDFTDPLNPIPVHKGERLAEEPDGFFHTTYFPIVGPISNAPTDNPYTGPVVWQTNGDPASTTSVDYLTGLIGVESVSVADFQYLFATAGPSGVGANNAPSLSNGRVSPDPGESTNEYTYTVVYTDPDGTMGQAPYYIRVRIDGVAYDMVRQSGQANPDYRQGVTYYYRTSTLIPALPHYFYFETSDGQGYAVYDNRGGRNTNIGAIEPIPGPYVNNKPTLTAPAGGAVTPVPGQPLNVGDPMNFAVIYTDANNEMPNAGYPVVYIRKVIQGQIPPVTPPEPITDYRVVSVSGSTITAVKPDGSSPAWTVNDPAIVGLPLQITSGGPASMTTHRITSNTADTVTVYAPSGNIPDVLPTHTFSIGKIILGPDANDTGGATDGLRFEYRLHNIGEGEYAVHFTSITTELIGVGGLTRDTTLRYPVSGELTGIRIVSDRKPGNVAPVLSNGAVVPLVGRSSDAFSFSVTYKDLDGDPPGVHDQVVGYVRLIIDGQVGSPIAMTGAGNYVTGVVFSAVVPGGTFAAGPHTCYFEASDGWLPVVRYPAGSATLAFSVNRKPTLESPAVTPTTGNEGTPYTFSVIYRDADNQRPPDGTVLLWLDGVSYPMDIDTSSGVNFVSGVRYTKTIHDPAIMTVGAHSFYVSATDGLEAADDSAVVAAPVVHANTAPTLTVPMVDPTSRWETSTYTYSVVYTDANGDAPEYVKVYIDGEDEANAFTMVKVAGQNDYTAGVTYTYAKQGLPLGSDHTYVFTASDHLASVRSPLVDVHHGPTVGAKPTAALVVNQPSPAARIGVATTITGSISPAMPVTITITFTRPDGTTFTRTANASGATGVFSLQWTPDMTGALPGPAWSVVASWAGNDDYAGVLSVPIIVTVTGPSTTVQGLDMVSIPLDPANPFPGAVYGDGSYALAKYLPRRNNYSYYRSLGAPGGSGSIDLPLSEIVLGGGYWIKIYEGQSKVVAPSGDLASSVANFVIPVYTGWNQIGCPFTARVAWGSLKVRSGAEILDLAAAAQRGWVRAYGWTFQQSSTDPYAGEYKLVDATRNGAIRYMDPWRGYWFKALRDCELLVPPPSIPMQAQKSLSIASVQKTGWEVQLSASVGNKTDADNAFGYSVHAMSVESPGYLENYIDLCFIGDNGKGLAYDVRPSVVDGESWPFSVSTDQTEGMVQVTWAGLDSLPVGKTLTLVDETVGKSVVMAPGGVYMFPASEGSRAFRVTLGSK